MPEQPFIGEISLFAFNFVPRNYASCSGGTLSISDNASLFALIGTAYGGDGRNNFCLPDLRGRSAVGYGQGTGLDNIQFAHKGGNFFHTLNPNEMPSHSHVAVATPVPHTHTATLRGENENADMNVPEGKMLGKVGARSPIYTDPSAAVDKDMAPDAVVVEEADATVSVQIQNAGNGQSFNIRSPYLGLNYCIALQGVFPQRT